MLNSKLYLKIKYYIRTNKKAINKFTAKAMVVILLIIFINTFFSVKILVNKADIDQINHKYSNALFLYGLTYSYYNINHFSKENKALFLRIPYEIAVCQLKQNNKRQSLKALSDASAKIVKQYGADSKENADFLRQYLIEYNIKTNNLQIASEELLYAFNIYRKVGFNQNIIADLLRQNGDIFYAQANYQKADFLYDKAFSIIMQNYNKNSPDIDYEIYTKIVHNICDCEVKTGQVDNAINIYQDTLKFLQQSSFKQNEAIANISLSLGDLYIKKGDSVSEAISCYNRAIDIIKNLPKASPLRKNLYSYYKTLKDLYVKNNQSYKASDIDLELARRRRFAFIYE